MWVEAVKVALAASVTVQVTRYVPAAAGAVNVGPGIVALFRAAVASAPVGSSTLQLYVYGDTPPVAEAVRLLFWPLGRLMREAVTSTHRAIPT